MVNKPNNDGITPLKLAFNNKNFDAVAFMLKYIDKYPPGIEQSAQDFIQHYANEDNEK